MECQHHDQRFNHRSATNPLRGLRIRGLKPTATINRRSATNPKLRQTGALAKGNAASCPRDGKSLIRLVRAWPMLLKSRLEAGHADSRCD